MKRLAPFALAMAFGLASPTASAESVGTLTLDGLSLVSFQDEEVYPLAEGSTLRFVFGAVQADGSIPFAIAPGDVQIAPIALPGGATLTYTLASSASGTMRSTEDGRRMDLDAEVAATLHEPGAPSGGSFTYAVPLTTESASATNLSGTTTVEISGMRLVDGVWYVQLVGATVNRENAFPKPGTAVYIVLSGSFDRLPPLP